MIRKFAPVVGKNKAFVDSGKWCTISSGGKTILSQEIKRKFFPNNYFSNKEGKGKASIKINFRIGTKDSAL
jgi:hypothetical protein